jgi:hypothetical protein
MEQIAILTSTASLRKTTTRHGSTKQRFNLDACLELADRFGVIIIGSLAADEVYQHVENHLPREVRSKFRLYPRSFFHKFRTENPVEAVADDLRDPAWQQILSENGIRFDSLKTRVGKDGRKRQKKFNWEELHIFIRDERVTLVTGGEGSLLYEKLTRGAG